MKLWFFEMFYQSFVIWFVWELKKIVTETLLDNLISTYLLESPDDVDIAKRDDAERYDLSHREQEHDVCQRIHRLLVPIYWTTANKL